MCPNGAALMDRFTSTHKHAARRSRIATRLAIACAIAVLAARDGDAIERMRLPTFALTSVDGRSTSSDLLVRPGKWLLLYVQPNCVPCEAILRLVKKDEHPLIASHLVVVVGAATPDAVRDGAARFPDLAEAGWYADPSRAAVAPLRLPGVPVIFGM